MTSLGAFTPQTPTSDTVSVVLPHATGRPRRRPVTLRGAVGYALLCLVALTFMMPLLAMVATSLKPANEVFSSPPTFIGSEIRWENYAEAFQYAPFGTYLLNSLLVAVVGTAVNVAVASLSAYAFARLKWRGRRMSFAVFLATMMVPQEVIIVPAFVIMQRLGWVNTYQALILPWAFAAFGAFMLRQFYLTIPQELDDAARIDGAGVWRTFFSVMLPLARPSIAVLAVFTFITYWNSFLWPLIIVNDVSRLGTVPLGLQQFFGQQGSQWHLVMAASVMSMLPMVILLVLLQKHLVRGIVTSGLGGR